MWYGYVGPGLTHVTQDFKTIERLSILFPYSKFRKSLSEEGAWQFVHRWGQRPELTNVVRYGDTFNKHFVTVEYIIGKDSVYYNIFTKNIGYIKLVVQDPNISVENRTELIKVRLKNIFLNNDFISSHAVAIYHIIKLLGNYVDVEIKVPDHSIFYMLTSYTGRKPIITRVLKFIDSRKGKVSVTLMDWKQQEEGA